MEDIRKKMYFDYIVELCELCGAEKLTQAEMARSYAEVTRNPFLKWEDVYAENDREKQTNSVGFLIYGTFPECHPDADYYFAETYIKPDYRRKGIMKEKVQDFVKTNGGVYCLFVGKRTPLLVLSGKKHFPRLDIRNVIWTKPISVPLSSGSNTKDIDPCQLLGYE